MRKLLLLAVVAGALCFAGSATQAEAGSVYIGVGGPRVGYGYGGYGGYRGYGYGGYRGGYGWGGGYRNGWGGYGGYGGWNGGWNHGCYRPPIYRW